MSQPPDFVLIGIVARPHGVRGEVCINPVSQVEGRFRLLQAVLINLGSEVKEFKVEKVRAKGKQVILKLAGIETRDQAEGLRNAEIGVRFADVAPLPEDTFYVFDLIGCHVVGNASGVIGKVGDVLQMPANDVLVVETQRGEILIPFVKCVIRNVDLKNKLISIEEIEGLLDL